DPETMVVVNIYMVQRRPDVYPEPERFRPERFLEQKPPKYTWIPFGGGERGCFGASLALAEMNIVSRTILRRTRLAPVGGGDEKIVRRGVSFSPSEGARVVLQERLPTAAPVRAKALSS